MPLKSVAKGTAQEEAALAAVIDLLVVMGPSLERQECQATQQTSHRAPLGREAAPQNLQRVGRRWPPLSALMLVRAEDLLRLPQVKLHLQGPSWSGSGPPEVARVSCFAPDALRARAGGGGKARAGSWECAVSPPAERATAPW